MGERAIVFVARKRWIDQSDSLLETVFFSQQDLDSAWEEVIRFRRRVL